MYEMNFGQKWSMKSGWTKENGQVFELKFKLERDGHLSKMVVGYFIPEAKVPVKSYVIHELVISETQHGVKSILADKEIQDILNS